MLTRRVFGMRVAAAIAGLAAMVAVSVPAARADDKVVVFAAASLKNALDNVNAAWKAETGKEATSPMERARRLPSRSRAAPRRTSSRRPTSPG